MKKLKEFDGKDEICDHLIAFLDNLAVGTLRMRYLDDKTVKIERLAVLSRARGQGIGNKIINEALLIIANKKIPEVVINASCVYKRFILQVRFCRRGRNIYRSGYSSCQNEEKVVETFRRNVCTGVRILYKFIIYNSSLLTDRRSEAIYGCQKKAK
ncbi:GNAT family N-acetyltransferase [Plectonema radiosum NIES-515]|uniref:GNAT family N-acetyltransferase n=1 Tax=Plectonema radiosum NIES-515 TaxID=2986073 RepID=A0ABT3B3T4_9CYAN|nr:GNAT family N-acetyltransferase [Plectonema radiosum NIES-515]